MVHCVGLVQFIPRYICARGKEVGFPFWSFVSDEKSTIKEQEFYHGLHDKGRQVLGTFSRVLRCCTLPVSACALILTVTADVRR